MRKILFKAKAENNGDWVYGYVFYDYERSAYVIACEAYSGDNIYVDVIAKTIGQFTGAKDKIGNMIFEGDIIKSKCYGCDWDEICVSCVNYAGHSATFYYECSKGSQSLYQRYGDIIEVIGNIHENPELLKGE